MSATDSSVAEPIAVPEPIVRPRRRVQRDEQARRQPPYAVVLHNDDLNGMDFVVGALRKVFNYDRLKALGLMMQAHISGRSIVWTGSLEDSELKRDQLQSCGPDPAMKDRGAQPLSVSVEPMPA